MTTIKSSDLRVIDAPPLDVPSEPAEAVTSPARWPFFFGGDADGSAEHPFVIEDLIHEDTVAMIFGRQGSLKTQLVADAIAHVGQGIPYQGLETTRGSTIYIAAEGAGAIGKRFAGVYLEHPELPRDAVVCVPQAVNLTREDEVAAFAKFAVDEIVPKLTMPVRLIVYDTLSKSMPGHSDSDDESIGLVESSGRRIARAVGEANEDGFVPAGLVVHHPRKNDESYRGSGAIEGNFDTIMHVRKTDAERLEDRLYEVELLKVKDGPIDRTWAYRAALVHVGTTPRGKQNYAPVVRYVGEEERVAVAANAATRDRKLTKNQRHLVELVVRIETRDGRKSVPPTYLAESGYAAHMEQFGGLGDMPVNGILVSDLQQIAYSEDPDGIRGEDGRWTVSEAGRKRWERRRDSLISAGHAWSCGGWLWLTPDGGRTVEDGRNG